MTNPNFDFKPAADIAVDDTLVAFSGETQKFPSVVVSIDTRTDGTISIVSQPLDHRLDGLFRTVFASDQLITVKKVTS